MVVFPNCKINIGLNIVAKRPDGFHDLQTLFYPLPLQDALEVVTNEKGEGVKLETTGIRVDGPPEDNICIKAYDLLKKDFPSLPAVHMHLHKAIPIGAGLGGGSADGAFTLLLLNKKYNLQIPEQTLLHYALQLGSDCPFFIKNVPCLGSGRGEDLVPFPLNLTEDKIIIVNPGIHIPTGWAFAQLTPKVPDQHLKEVLQMPISQWKKALTNDFEKPIFEHYPEIKDIKEALYHHGAVYASMSGTGSTLYGIFPKAATPSFAFPAHYFVKEC